tara:strand:- start:915 stop:1871 length:957 start_codon:yes stop_codon:yes gene_type:complete
MYSYQPNNHIHTKYYPKALSFILMTIIVSFFLLSCSDINSTINSEFDDFIEILDTNFESHLLALGIDTEGLIDQKILKSDAELVTRLSVNKDENSIDGRIEDLTGIGGFVNLTYLSVQSQGLKSINLEKNTLLDTLLIGDNYLEGLDVSQNDSLVYLDAIFNELKVISGLNELSNLTELQLSYNYLETLQVENANLERLFVSDNLLKNVNVSGAENLSNVYVPRNQLEEFHVNDNINLETLILSDNKLTSIELEDLSKLEVLYISSNELTSLNISNNDKLVDFRPNRNPGLYCIQVSPIQIIPNVYLSDYQELSSNCE